jgi:hypothetical protein
VHFVPVADTPRMSENVENVRPLADTTETLAAKNRLYRFWNANRKKAGDDWYKSDIENVFRNDALFATIGSVLISRDLVTSKEWDRLRSEYYRKFVEGYIDEQTGKYGLKRVD